MQEDGNIGLDCSLFSILVAFRASSNPSTSAPGCQAEKFEAKGSGHEAKMARAILFKERIVNWGTEVLKGRREVDTKPKWLERFFARKE